MWSFGVANVTPKKDRNVIMYISCLGTYVRWKTGRYTRVSECSLIHHTGIEDLLLGCGNVTINIGPYCYWPNR